MLARPATVLEAPETPSRHEHEQRNSRRILSSGSSASNPRGLNGACDSPLSTSPTSWRPRSPTVVRSPHAEIIRQQAESAQEREAEMDRAWESAERASESASAAELAATSFAEKERHGGQPNVSVCDRGDNYGDVEDSLSTSPLGRLYGSKFAAWRSLLPPAASRVLTQPLNLSRSNQRPGRALERRGSGLKDYSRSFHAMLLDLHRGIESGAQEGASSTSTGAARSPSGTNAPLNAHPRRLHRRARSLTSITTSQEFSLLEDSAGVLPQPSDLQKCSSNGEDAARREGHVTESAAAGAGSGASEKVPSAVVPSSNGTTQFIAPRDRSASPFHGSGASADLSAPVHRRKVSFNSVVQVRVYLCADS
ncbi:unnamed protein product [Closterium sp. NIES-64]|nr:unnamed protein product [Closterium sp. NIES-64]